VIFCVLTAAAILQLVSKSFQIACKEAGYHSLGCNGFFARSRWYACKSLAGLQDHFALLEKALANKVPVVFVMDVPARHKAAAQSPFPGDPRLPADRNGIGRMYSTHAGLVVANNSSVRGGLFFPETSRKSARFISICDSLVFLADDAGFMVGPQDEKAGIMREGALLFSTIANCAVPKLSVVLRRSYTAGVHAMAGAGFIPDSFLALPGAVISIYGKGIMEKLSSRGFDESENEALIEMMSSAEDPHRTLEMGLLDEVIGLGSLRDRIALLKN
jgi:Carboxyl transferase domain